MPLSSCCVLHTFLCCPGIDVWCLFLDFFPAAYLLDATHLHEAHSLSRCSLRISKLHPMILFIPLSSFVSLWNWSEGVKNPHQCWKGPTTDVSVKCTPDTRIVITCHDLSSRSAVKVYHLELVSQDAKARSASRLYQIVWVWSKHLKHDVFFTKA